MLPMVVEALEEFDNGVAGALEVGVGQSTHHRLKDVGDGREALEISYEVDMMARARTATARTEAADTSKKPGTAAARAVMLGTTSSRAATSKAAVADKRKISKVCRRDPWSR